MTREEAKEFANNMSYREAIYNLMQAKSIPYRKATFIKINELLKALEQEPILDKIRADIEDLTYYCCEVHPRTVIDDVLGIIDKYKAESESDA